MLKDNKTTGKKPVKETNARTVKEKKLPLVKTKKAVISDSREKSKPALKPANEDLSPILENGSETIILPEKVLEGGAYKVKYIETVGRRKTAVARVRLFTQNRKGIIVNNKPYTEYFPKFLHKIIEDPLEKLKCLGKFGISVVVRGGGTTGQAESTRHGIARALVALNPYFKKRLKKSGFLTRDPRMRERKKFGLKRARRAPQWSKR